MITKLLKKAFMPLLVLLVVSATQNVNAQCTVRPADSYTAVGWSPTCNNGTNGEIRITGIQSTIGAGDYTNAPYV